MSFDRIAPYYRWLERVLAGGKLQRCRVKFLDAIQPGDEILSAGEGVGRFAAAVARRFPDANFVCLDASGAMLQRAARSWARAGGNPRRLRLLRAALPDASALAGEFDVVATHFFLDCFPGESLAPVVQQLAGVCKPRARWLLADFREAGAGLKRIRCRLILASMYWFFRRATAIPARRLAPPDALLGQAGFQLARRAIGEWGLLHSDLWERPASTQTSQERAITNEEF